MASITHYGEGWRAHLYADGKRESRFFRLRREAERWAAKREAELRGGGTAITFGEATERWLAGETGNYALATHRRCVQPMIIVICGGHPLRQNRRSPVNQ